MTIVSDFGHLKFSLQAALRVQKSSFEGNFRQIARVNTNEIARNEEYHSHN